MVHRGPVFSQLCQGGWRGVRIACNSTGDLDMDRRIDQLLEGVCRGGRVVGNAKSHLDSWIASKATQRCGVGVGAAGKRLTHQPAHIEAS